MNAREVERRNKKEAARYKRLKDVEAAEAAEFEKVLTAHFEKFDANYSASLDATEIRTLITTLELGAEPDDAVLSRMIKYTSGKDATSVARPDLAKLLYIYKDFIVQHEVVEKTFLDHDKDQSGFLELPELLSLLTKLTPDETVTDSDLAFVMQKCDKNSDGKISSGELLFVGSTWLAVKAKEKYGADDPAELVDLNTFQYETIIAFEAALEAAAPAAYAAPAPAPAAAPAAPPAAAPPADYAPPKEEAPASAKKSSMCILL